MLWDEVTVCCWLLFFIRRNRFLFPVVGYGAENERIESPAPDLVQTGEEVSYEEGSEDVWWETRTCAVADSIAELQVDANDEAGNRYPNHRSLAFLDPIQNADHEDAWIARDLILVIRQGSVRNRVDGRVWPHDAVRMLVGNDVSADEPNGEKQS